MLQSVLSIAKKNSKITYFCSKSQCTRRKTHAFCHVNKTHGGWCGVVERADLLSPVVSS